MLSAPKSRTLESHFVCCHTRPINYHSLENHSLPVGYNSWHFDVSDGPWRQHHTLNFPNIRDLSSGAVCGNWVRRAVESGGKADWWQLSVWTKTLPISEEKPNVFPLNVQEKRDSTSAVSRVIWRCREGNVIFLGWEIWREDQCQFALSASQESRG